MALATARLTRLVTTDKIAEHLVIHHLRERSQVKAPVIGDDAVPANLAAYLTEMADCPYCSGFWISLGVLTGEVLFGRRKLWRIFTGALALNYVTAHVSARIDH